LYFILHCPLSFVGQKMALKIFLSKTPKMASPLSIIRSYSLYTQQWFVS
jgi:hypothetical protein